MPDNQADQANHCLTGLTITQKTCLTSTIISFHFISFRRLCTSSIPHININSYARFGLLDVPDRAQQTEAFDSLQLTRALCSWLTLFLAKRLERVSSTLRWATERKNESLTSFWKFLLNSWPLWQEPQDSRDNEVQVRSSGLKLEVPPFRSICTLKYTYLRGWSQRFTWNVKNVHNHF